ncbi:MAG: hypothetical protein FJ387_10135 [Verrucomicrobia bacterium]|nr:hypothetical protein [Verrucomicrobiota bacterium]
MRRFNVQIHALIDAFVQKVNLLCVEPEWADEVPAELRLAGPNAGGLFYWQIQRTRASPWVEKLEKRMGHRFPPAYRSLVTRYRFASFSAGGLRFLANTGQAVENELGCVLDRDPVLAKVIVAAGYLPFARPAEGSPDPVGFDANRLGAEDEAPVVRVDYEAASSQRQVQVVGVLADSFAEFARRMLARA